MPHIYAEGDRITTLTPVGTYAKGATGTIARVHFGSMFLFDYDVQFDDGMELSVHEDEIQYYSPKLPNRLVARVWWALVKPILRARGWDV